VKESYHLTLPVEVEFINNDLSDPTRMLDIWLPTVQLASVV
jgi:hypothetical protein